VSGYDPDHKAATAELARLDRGLLVIGLVAFLAILGAYVGLSIAADKDPDPEGIVQMVLTLAAVFGLGTYQRATHKSQARQLATITEQTNGVLTKRIKAGTIEALREVLTDEQIVQGTEKAVRNALAAHGVERLADPDDDGGGRLSS